MTEMPRSLDGWLEYIERVHPQTIAMGLDRVRKVKDVLGLAPACPVVTVGGTNGKGSACMMLEAIWHHAGYKTGCYTSPHLLRYNERVRIACEPAGDASLLPAGAYTASFNVTHGANVLPTVHSTVYLATPPAQVASVAVSRVSRTTAAVTWPAVDNAAPVSYKYRVYRVSSGTWSAWRYTSAGSTRAVLRKLRSGARYRVEVIATNALGEGVMTVA